MGHEEEIENEIQAKGLTAPRVTAEHIANIIMSAEYHIFPNSMLTVCNITLKNGFNVTGTSACASPENFDAELGRKIARRNAENEIWVLEGYLLKQKLYENKL